MSPVSHPPLRKVDSQLMNFDPLQEEARRRDRLRQYLGSVSSVTQHINDINTDTEHGFSWQGESSDQMQVVIELIDWCSVLVLTSLPDQVTTLL